MKVTIERVTVYERDARYNGAYGVFAEGGGGVHTLFITDDLQLARAVRDATKKAAPMLEQMEEAVRRVVNIRTEEAEDYEMSECTRVIVHNGEVSG